MIVGELAAILNGDVDPIDCEGSNGRFSSTMVGNIVIMMKKHDLRWDTQLNEELAKILKRERCMSNNVMMSKNIWMIFAIYRKQVMPQEGKE